MRLAKYGWVRITAACPAQAKLRRLLRRRHATLQHVTVTRHSDGHWYATVTYDPRGTRSRPGSAPPRPGRSPAWTGG